MKTVLLTILVLVAGCTIDTHESVIADSDGDGVSDFADLCTNTRTIELVNHQGCLDADQDGVSDIAFDGRTAIPDQCLGSPAGVQVDRDGCAIRSNPSNTYEGCQTNSDCNSLNDSCETVTTSWPDRTTTAGYCTRGCSDMLDCPVTARGFEPLCASLNASSPFQCYETCDRDGDCAIGFHCGGIDSGDTICLPY